MHHDQLMEAVHSFKHHANDGSITYSGSKPPSCGETDLLSETYNPQTECRCDKEPYSKDGSLNSIQLCGAHQGMLDAMDRVLDRQEEWNSTDLFTADKLKGAVAELLLVNTKINYASDTCQGIGTAHPIPEIEAPDRRPNPGVDGSKFMFNQLYPTPEQMKICADAKYYGVTACGAGLCDEGLARAIADSCNDVLIGDYCGAADAKGLRLLQQTCSKLAPQQCHFLSSTIWLAVFQIGNLRILFRFFRDHTRDRLPNGLFGNRMTGLAAHRHIDIAAYHGVMTAWIATGQQLTEQQFMKTVEACVYINDFVDFRGDTMRKQRENPILRGIEGNICAYLDRMIAQCLDAVNEVMESSNVGALVAMGYCNWAFLGSHHKVYELFHGVKRVQRYSPCKYESQANTSRYDRLLRASQPYGTLGSDGPQVTKKRIEMDKMYSMCRSNPKMSLAWLADATRSLLDPFVLRRIVDVVHFEWCGDVGAKDYCP
ncbi:hypothetical protein N7488_008323 [Penicillium malachiteum]|nr:hypothetical protein N7488_008323 [Penicillium malachiteum]